MNIPVLQNSTGKGRWNWSLLEKGSTVCLLLFLLTIAVLPARAQGNITVKGRIVNEKAQPVASASVVVKGTATGTATDENGNYQILAPANGTLVISSIGYPAKEIPINNQATHNVTLTSSTTDLEQVVVVGYGTQRKEAVTGSVASIGGEAVREVPAPNVAQALQGRIAGVDISQTSTKPGASMQIRIRGTRSLTGSNDPLVVLDGIPFPGSIADINPNDIKSIDILKDASATAIYGSRGANGVILITTNKGIRGRKAQISYNAYYGVQKLFSKFPMMNGPEFAALRKAAGMYTNGTDESDSINTDWQDLFFRTGFVTSHDVTLSGGTSDQGSYSLGLGYYQNQGVVPTQQYKRYSVRLALDQGIGKYFRMGFTSYNNYNKSEGNQVGLYGVLSMSPIANPYNPDGTLKRTIRMPLDETYTLTRSVVEGLKDEWVNETRGFATYNAIYGEVQIPWVRGLKYRTNLGLDFIQNNNGNFTGQGINSTTPTTVSTAGISNSQNYHWTLENLLTYDHTFAQKHNINAVALYSAERTKYNSSSASSRDISNEAFQFYNLGATLDPNSINVGGSYSLRGLLSWMGRVMYSYDNRYMVSATVRSDGSSVLAAGHQWHTYPAVSVGWNIGNESFMQDVTVINRLKLRAGYGQTSNQAINPYQTLGTLSSRPYNFGPSGYVTGYYVTQAPNANLGWEYSKTWNYGMDFSLLRNRLTGTIEYYVTNTSGILQNVSLPATAGVGYFTGNVGEIQNRGWEFSLNATILNNRDGLTWDAGFNIYSNHNELVALASGKTRDEGNLWFVGHNINALYDYKNIGLWQKDDPNRAVLQPGSDKDIIGSIKVEYTGGYDANGVPLRKIGPEDRQVLDVDPNFQGGFNTRLAYKGFDLTMVAAFKSGGLLVSTLYGSAGYLNMLSGRRNNVKVDYWTPENTDAKYPNPASLKSGDNPNYASTLGYFDASYLKFRTITLGYDFRQSLLKNSGVNLRMYVTAQNPFVLFSPYYKESGMDPEPNSYGNENSAVSSYPQRILTVGFNTPATRNYVVGLNLTF